MDDIIRKIQKLLALTNNPNEAEATSAMGKVQELLAKYNLDLAVIKEEAVAGGTVPVEEKREKTKINRSAMYEWQRDLWNAVALANFCWHWTQNEFTGKYSRTHEAVFVKRHTVLGRESNVIAVRIMGEYLCETIERLLPYANTERLSRSAISWRKGCAERLIERIQAQTEELKNQTMESSAGTAIALRSIFDKEQEANWDAVYGKGDWAARQLRQAQRDREWDAAMAECAAGTTAVTLPAVKAETEAQRLRREEKERAQNDKYWARQEAKAKREAAKVDWSAYRSGKEAGGSISLSKQVPSTSKKEIK